MVAIVVVIDPYLHAIPLHLQDVSKQIEIAPYIQSNA
jgi:hypothetical protein